MVLGQLSKKEKVARRKLGACVMSKKECLEYRRRFVLDLVRDGQQSKEETLNETPTHQQHSNDDTILESAGYIEEEQLVEEVVVDDGIELDGRRVVDVKHEPDGTHPTHVDAPGAREDDEHVENKSGFFRIGINHGARLMSEAIDKVLLSIKGGEVYDDVSGEQLDPRLVKAARALEMEFFKRLGAYTLSREQRRFKVELARSSWADGLMSTRATPNSQTTGLGSWARSLPRGR